MTSQKLHIPKATDAGKQRLILYKKAIPIVSYWDCTTIFFKYEK
ncbi:hypothetical protein DOT_1003 [Desulfosporosinus sp. OT]|nr:hypothetical protein DOT_1003 [Desulfosporosinus sp. OT]